MAKYGERDGEFFRKGKDGGITKVDPSEYYASKFMDPTGMESLAASFLDRKTQPARNIGAPEVPGITSAAEAGRESHPYYSMAGDAAAYIDPLPSGIIAGTLSAGAQGLAYAREGEGIVDAMFGMAGQRAGDMAGRVIGKIANTFKKAEPGPVTDAAQEWIDMGGPTTPGEREGSRWLQQREKDFRRIPGASDVMQEADEAKRAFMNKQAVESVGLDSAKFPKMNEDAIDQVYKNYSDEVYPMFDGIDSVSVPEEVVDSMEGIPGMLSKSNLKRWGKLYGMDYTPATKDAAATLEINGRGLKAIRDEFSEWAGKKQSDKSSYGRQGREEIDSFIETLVPEEGMDTYARHRRNVNIANNMGTKSSMGDLNPLSAYKKMKGLPYDDPSFTRAKDTMRIGASPEFNQLLTKQGVSDTGGILSDARGLYAKPLADAYMSGNYMPRGILEPVDKRIPALGGNIGRIGLLGATGE